jgi:hypothetical protein
VTGMGTMSSGCSRQFGAVSSCSRQSLDCYHTQILGLIHGATTHENSATMSLYGYDLAQYVVETNLGVPTGGTNYVGAQFVLLEMCGFGCSQHP